MDQVISLGKIEDVTEQADYILENYCKVNPKDIDPDEKVPLMAVIGHLISEAKLVSAPYSFETNSLKFNTPKNLLRIKIRYFVDLVNQEFEIENYHVIAALIYREDWSKDYNEDEIIRNAELFYGISCKYAYWGAEQFANLLNLLKETYPVLYKNKAPKESEGRRMYNLVHAFAKEFSMSPTVAGNEELSTLMIWLEEKEIERLNEKQQQGSY